MTTPPWAQRILALRRYVSWELCAALLVLTLVLLPILRTALINDDQFNSNFRGLLHYQDISLWEYISRHHRRWIDTDGRWFPVGIVFGSLVFWFFHSFLIYKLFLIAAGLLAAAATFWMLRVVGLARPVAGLVVVAVAAATQYRNYYDPHFSFNGLTQLVMIQVAVALGTYQRWLTTGKWRWLALSLLVAFLSASTYEAVYLFAPLYIVLAMRARRAWWPVVRASVGPVGLMVTMIAWSGHLRSQAAAGPNGPYAPSSDVREFFYTFGDQFSAAVPLSHLYFDPSGIYASFSVWNLGWGDLVVGLTASVVTIALLWRARWGGWSPLQTGTLGLLLWAIVAAASSLSQRYQQELVAGLGNVPIYLEEVAFAIVVVSAAGLLLRWAPLGTFVRRYRGVAAVFSGTAFGLLVMLQHNANGVVVNIQQPLREVRITDNEASRAGILHGLPMDRRTRVYLATYRPYMDSGYYWMNGRRDVDVWYLPAAGTDGVTPAVPRECSLDTGRGAAVLQSVQMVGRNTVGVVAVGCTRPSEKARFFLRGFDSKVWLAGADFAGRPFVAAPERLLERDGDLWRARDPRAIDPSTLSVIPSVAGPATGALSGCYEPEGSAIWCRQRWKVPVVGPPGRDVVLSFSIENVEDANASLTITNGRSIRSIRSTRGRTVQQRVRIGRSGITEVGFRYAGPQLVQTNGDPRRLYVRLRGVRVALPR